MEINTINGHTVLSASDGMLLRNGDNFSETVVLGDYDKAENYTEVSRDEYEAFVRERQKAEEDAMSSTEGMGYGTELQGNQQN